MVLKLDRTTQTISAPHIGGLVCLVTLLLTSDQRHFITFIFPSLFQREHISTLYIYEYVNPKCSYNVLFLFYSCIYFSPMIPLKERFIYLSNLQKKIKILTKGNTTKVSPVLTTKALHGAHKKGCLGGEREKITNKVWQIMTQAK